MNYPLTSLQMDTNGRLNVSMQGMQGIEHVLEPIDSSDLTIRTTKNRTLTVANRPVISRERVVADATDAANAYRKGPIVIPYMRHLMGQNRGAFCADSNIFIASSKAAAVYPAGTLVGLYDCDAVLFIPKIQLTGDISTYPSVVGIVRGVVEDANKRTYTTATGSEEENLYVVQYAGITKALVSKAVTAAGSTLYNDTTDKYGLTSTGLHAVAIYLGATLELNAAVVGATIASAYNLALVCIIPGSGSSSASDMSTYAFGYTINTSTVTVTSGYVRHGLDTPVLVAAENVSISADHTFIYIRCTATGGAASILSTLTYPVNTTTYYNVPLHQFRLIDGAITVEKIHHVGDIHIPGVFA